MKVVCIRAWENQRRQKMTYTLWLLHPNSDSYPHETTQKKNLAIQWRLIKKHLEFSLIASNRNTSNGQTPFKILTVKRSFEMFSNVYPKQIMVFF